jgi:hypothetical protein
MPAAPDFGPPIDPFATPSAPASSDPLAPAAPPAAEDPDKAIQDLFKQSGTGK